MFGSRPIYTSTAVFGHIRPHTKTARILPFCFDEEPDPVAFCQKAQAIAVPGAQIDRRAL